MPNLRIMETDIDRLAWDDELVTTRPSSRTATSSCRTGPAGAATPNEDALRAHPPKAGHPGLLNYGQKK